MIDDWWRGFLSGIGIASMMLLVLVRYLDNFNEEIIRNEVNDVRDYIPKSDKYYLQSYRYLELKAYCRQYQSWKQGLASCYGFKSNGFGNVPIRPSEHSDPTERAVELAEKYRLKIDMVELAANRANEVLAPYILLNVTQGLSFERLTAQGRRPPCGINQFYEARQKFFWELDQLKE